MISEDGVCLKQHGICMIFVNKSVLKGLQGAVLVLVGVKIGFKKINRAPMWQLVKIILEWLLIL
jgi:hypothetical protein